MNKIEDPIASTKDVKKATGAMPNQDSIQRLHAIQEEQAAKEGEPPVTKDTPPKLDTGDTGHFTVYKNLELELAKLKKLTQVHPEYSTLYSMIDLATLHLDKESRALRDERDVPVITPEEIPLIDETEIPEIPLLNEDDFAVDPSPTPTIDELTSARDAYIKARANSLKYAGAKSILGIFGKNKRTSEELEEKRTAYQRARELFVGSEVSKFAQEQSTLADVAIANAATSKEHPTFKDKVYGVYKTLGDLNLMRLLDWDRRRTGGKKVESKFVRGALGTLSVRTAIGYGLLNIATAGTGSLIGWGALGAQRILSGTGTSVGTYTLLEGREAKRMLNSPTNEKKIVKEEKEFQKIKGDEKELLKKLHDMEAWSEFNHEPLTENPAYKKYHDAYTSRLHELIEEKVGHPEAAGEYRNIALASELSYKMRKSDDALEARLKNHTWRREGRKALAAIAGGLVASGALMALYHKLFDHAPDVASPVKPKATVTETPPVPPTPEAPKTDTWSDMIDNTDHKTGFHDSSWYSTRQIFQRHIDDLTAEGMGPRVGESPEHWAERMTANAVKHTESLGGGKVPSLVHPNDMVHLARDGNNFKISVDADSGYATGELPHHGVPAGGAETAPTPNPPLPGEQETGLMYDENGQLYDPNQGPPPSSTDGLEFNTETGSATPQTPHVEAPAVTPGGIPTEVITTFKTAKDNIFGEYSQILNTSVPHSGSNMQKFLNDNLNLGLTSPYDASSFVHYIDNVAKETGVAAQDIITDPAKVIEHSDKFTASALENAKELAKGNLFPVKGKSLLVMWHEGKINHIGYLKHVSKWFRDRFVMDIDGNGTPDGPLMSKEEIIKTGLKVGTKNISE